MNSYKHGYTYALSCGFTERTASSTSYNFETDPYKIIYVKNTKTGVTYTFRSTSFDATIVNALYGTASVESSTVTLRSSGSYMQIRNGTRNYYIYTVENSTLSKYRLRYNATLTDKATYYTSF